MASFCLILILFVCISSGFGQDPSCTTVKSAWRSKRLTESDVPPSAVDGNDLRVCPKDSGKQCCSRRMEDRFAGLARGDFDKAVSAKVGEMKTLFNEQAKTFDDYFRGLIKKSQQDLDSMFQKIYGFHYQQNTKIFMDLFVDMTNYYNFDTKLNVDDIMDKFFSNLMSRMFQIMNGRYQFSDSYLTCVSKYMENLQPFGDVPEKLKPQVRKVLIHARTFSKALHEGRDAIHMLENAISSSQECENHLVKLKYCSWCKAMTSLKPCFKFCTDVHKGCLADIAKVNTQWQSYMAALNSIIEKQTGPTNIQDVITRINLKISFAIMNFQNTDKMKEVKDKVFQAKECGNPGISKRSTDDFFLEGSNRERRDSSLTLARTDSSKESFDKLTTSFKAKMKVADNFWSTLPEKVCGEISTKDNSDCWNGIGKGSYTSPNDGGNSVAEVPKPMVQQAIDKLAKAVEQLNAAINGEEITPNEVDDSGSGSGSGDEESGESGDGNEVTEDYTARPITGSENEIDDESQEENVMGGGVGKPTPGLRRNSASWHHSRAWLLVSTLWLSLAIFIA